MGKKIQKQQRVKLEHQQLPPKEVPSVINSGKKQTKIEQKPLPPLKKQEPVINEQKVEKKEEAPKKIKKTKRARVIIRNLVFDINEKHIKKLMAPFGEVKEINIPRHPDRNTTKGFAFVEMATKLQCLKAIKKLNGTSFKGRPIVLDMAVSKQNYMTQKLNDPKQVKDPKEETVEKEEQISNSDNQKMKEEDNEALQQDDQDEQEQEQEEEDQEKDEQQEDQKFLKQKQDHRYEIFIRNLPISTTQDDLYKHFSKQGKIKFVKICKNKETNVSKGTAFIKFYDSEVPEKLIHYSRSYQMFLLKKLLNFVPDPTIKLQIDGVIMKIFPVESRTEIEGKLKDRSGEGKKELKVKSIKKIKRLEDLVKIDPHDKRKLSLALLGRWKATENMNEIDYDLLKSHEKEKIAKLKNPNSSISPTRIILKHLEKTITQEQIRSICYKFLADRNYTKGSLTYCKLMLEKDMKKSAGFAFVEFRKHEISKQFLQMLVKTPAIVQKKLFIVQFAIQDSRKLLKLSKKNIKGKDDKKKEARKNQKTGKGGSGPKKGKTFKKKLIKK